MRFEHVEDHGGCSYAVNGENLSAGARASKADQDQRQGDRVKQTSPSHVHLRSSRPVKRALPVRRHTGPAAYNLVPAAGRSYCPAVEVSAVEQAVGAPLTAQLTPLKMISLF